VLVSLASFALYVAMGHRLTAAKAFTSIALFNILRFPLAMFPQVISSLAEVSIVHSTNTINPPYTDNKPLYRMYMGHRLTAAKAFTSIALFNILRFPLAMFPQVISSLAEVSIDQESSHNSIVGECIDAPPTQQRSGRRAIIIRHPPNTFHDSVRHATSDAPLRPPSPPLVLPLRPPSPPLALPPPKALLSIVRLRRFLDTPEVPPLPDLVPGRPRAPPVSLRYLSDDLVLHTKARVDLGGEQ
jgi:hypothetical protein